MPAGCADPAGPAATSFALPVLWLEWPTAVTPAAHGAMTLTLVQDFCSRTALGFTVGANTLTLASTRTPTGQPCPLETFAPAFPTDTTLPLPALPATNGYPIGYEIRATLTLGSGESVERTAGQILVAAQPDTTRSMAGAGSLGPDSVGCVVLKGGYGFGTAHQYAVANPPALTASASVFARAHRVGAGAAAACGVRPAVHLDYVEAAIFP